MRYRPWCGHPTTHIQEMDRYVQFSYRGAEAPLIPKRQHSRIKPLGKPARQNVIKGPLRPPGGEAGNYM